MKPLILLTNDDGIHSPGLLAMAEAVKDLGELLIIAPRMQQTSMGRAFPRIEGLGSIEKVELVLSDRILTGYSILGSPAYAAAHGILELAAEKPVLCISGINYGENLGTNLTCSGTVGAVLEADTHGVPGIAFSIQADIGIQRSVEYAEMDWSIPQKVVTHWVNKILQTGIGYGASMLNINIPDDLMDVSQYRYTRQSRQNFFDFKSPPARALDQPYELPSEVNYHLKELERDSDIYAVCVDHYISVTPMVHDLTVRGLSVDKQPSIHAAV